MTEIKNNHQAVLKLQRAKNYFEDVAIEANQPPTVIAAFAGLIRCSSVLFRQSL